MSLQSHRRHLQQLLTQTITVLCRNTLPYAAQFSVEGLLGVTIDQDEVFLVNIRETVNKYGPPVETHESPKRDLTRHSYTPNSVEDVARSPPKPPRRNSEVQCLSPARPVPVSPSPPVPPSTPPKLLLPKPATPRTYHDLVITPSLQRRRSNSDDPQIIDSINRILQNAKAEMAVGPSPGRSGNGALHDIPARSPDPSLQFLVAENTRVLSDPGKGPLDNNHPPLNLVLSQEALAQGSLKIESPQPEAFTIKVEKMDDEEADNLMAGVMAWHQKVKDAVATSDDPNVSTAASYEDAMNRGVEAIMEGVDLHTNSGRLQCPLCKDALRSQYHLRRHLRTHVGTVLPYPVPALASSVQSPTPPVDPEEEFIDSGAIEDDDVDDLYVPPGRPGRRPVGRKDTRFTCTICGLRSKCRTDLQKHMYTHTGEKPHVCPECGKGFRQTGALNVHRRSHMGLQPTDRPFVCDTCGKGFKQSSHLNVHRLIHTGERPHTCPVCGKGFNVSSNLRKHMLYHTGELPYTCARCTMGFRHLSSLKTHIFKTHRGYDGSSLDINGMTSTDEGSEFGLIMDFNMTMDTNSMDGQMDIGKATPEPLNISPQPEQTSANSPAMESSLSDDQHGLQTQEKDEQEKENGSHDRKNKIKDMEKDSNGLNGTIKHSSDDEGSRPTDAETDAAPKGDLKHGDTDAGLESEIKPHEFATEESTDCTQAETDNKNTSSV